MTEQYLWEIVQKNAHHIEIINRELGGIQEGLIWIKNSIMWQLGIFGSIMTGIIVLSWRNLYWIKRNGNKK